MLEQVADDLHVLSVPHTMLGLHLGTRMTVLKLRDGSVLLHSLVPLSPETRRDLERIGPVRHLVVPNFFHHSYAADAQKAYPDATLYAPRALRRRRPDLRIDRDFDERLGETFGGELVPVPIDGCLLRETVFVHPRTRSVISSDLTENFTTSDHALTRAYLKATGIHGRVGWSLALRWLYYDRRAARRSLDQLLEHDFDRVVIAHGDVLRADGKRAVRATFEGWI